MPLPPYIEREPVDEDKERYQTLFASERGAVAAPTAGMHFTNELINKIKAKGVHLLTSYFAHWVGVHFGMWR